MGDNIKNKNDDLYFDLKENPNNCYIYNDHNNNENNGNEKYYNNTENKFSN